MTATAGARLTGGATGLIGREDELGPSSSSSLKTGLACSSSTVSAASASRPSSRRSPRARARMARSSSGSMAGPSSRQPGGSLQRSPQRKALVRTRRRRGPAPTGSPAIIVVDRYEVLRPLDLWLRQSFVPSMPGDTRLLLAGREPPVADWRFGLGDWFASLALGNLARAAAFELLRRDGTDERDLERIERLARGHPLSLRLAAASLVSGSAGDREAAPMSAIVDELTELYLSGLDPSTRQALDAASVVRRPTLSLLAAMLPDAEPQEAFDRLRRLPFVELGTDGLMVHDTVREGVAAYLRASDPDRWRRYRIAAWRQLRDEVSTGRHVRDVALHRGPALHARKPDDPRRLLPDHGAPIFGRWRPAGRLAIHRSARPPDGVSCHAGDRFDLVAAQPAGLSDCSGRRGLNRRPGGLPVSTRCRAR